ncbi:polysaccharide pyruvyl transferase family protein [Leptothoe sp. PORK10 BA2]|uniref:polysaccharide pyruvyl transferase family protein n=1 Tax=Leptothoe sp. PORK10 BA2 TaxID=3110254 RepID=UPI002B2173E8|nr:polysaccharide pyruvyl transferase family protein [Leptothoe sp. PORK10 BA2]MEA5462289.1 polysaccharide pyruvyl transferase family protein [Leptothoe sp. PORK10 BA2]
MKIFYYRRRDGQPNFGDELNTWLWPQFLPDFFDDDGTTQFIGTGTLINHRLPERTTDAKRLIIFSSGAGYEKTLPTIPSHWQIACVRGPLSAKRLQLPRQKAITDGGILVRRCFTPTGQKNNAYAFMPHIHHANFANVAWKTLCADMGIGYIDPRWPVEQILQAISQTEVLLAEAMHGAIVADALRTAWIPVITSPRILRFKWQDWCASIGVPYRPWQLLPLPEYPKYARGLRSSLQASWLWTQWGRQTLGQPVTLLSRSTADSMARVISHGQPTLSKDITLERLTTQLEESLSALKQPGI